MSEYGVKWFPYFESPCVPQQQQGRLLSQNYGNRTSKHSPAILHKIEILMDEVTAKNFLKIRIKKGKS